jgi:multisubunit Na+/H+ antiporter MnhB subunit
MAVIVSSMVLNSICLAHLMMLFNSKFVSLWLVSMIVSTIVLSITMYQGRRHYYKERFIEDALSNRIRLP